MGRLLKNNLISFFAQNNIYIFLLSALLRELGSLVGTTPCGYGAFESTLDAALLLGSSRVLVRLMWPEWWSLMSHILGSLYSGSIIPFWHNFYHIYILKRDSNLGLSLSHRLNHKAVNTQSPRLDTSRSLYISLNIEQSLKNPTGNVRFFYVTGSLYILYNTWLCNHKL